MEYILQNQHLVPRDRASFHFDDRGYYFGDGIYEVVRIYDGHPFAIEQHLKRFNESSQKLDMKIPFSEEELTSSISALITKNNLKNGIVYFQLTRGIEPRDHLYTRQSTPILTAFTKQIDDPSSAKKNGISVWLTDDIRWLRCDIKTINLLGNIMAKRAASDHDCDEAIMQRDRFVTEGSSSNLFLVSDNTLYTHPATNLILNGITRQIVIEIANELGLKVIEEAFPVDVLAHADEAFITSTVMEITPIISIKGQADATYEIGPVTRELQSKFNERIQSIIQ